MTGFLLLSAFCEDKGLSYLSCTPKKLAECLIHGVSGRVFVSLPFLFWEITSYPPDFPVFATGRFETSEPCLSLSTCTLLSKSHRAPVPLNLSTHSFCFSCRNRRPPAGLSAGSFPCLPTLVASAGESQVWLCTVTWRLSMQGFPAHFPTATPWLYQRFHLNQSFHDMVTLR